MVYQTSSHHIHAIMNNLRFIILDYSAAKQSGILDWWRDFCNWCIISSTHRDNTLYTHTQHWSWSIDWNRGSTACLLMINLICYARVWRIIVSTISWILPAVAAVVIIIQNVRWWSWTRLCCVWKLPIFPRDQSVHLRTQQPGSTKKYGLRDVKRAGFIRNWLRSGLTESGLTEVYHSYFKTIQIISLQVKNEVRQSEFANKLSFI